MQTKKEKERKHATSPSDVSKPLTSATPYCRGLFTRRGPSNTRSVAYMRGRFPVGCNAIHPWLVKSPAERNRNLEGIKTTRGISTGRATYVGSHASTTNSFHFASFRRSRLASSLLPPSLTHISTQSSHTHMCVSIILKFHGTSPICGITLAQRNKTANCTCSFVGTASLDV